MLARGRLEPRPALPYRNDHRHTRLQWRWVERGVEGRGSRGGAPPFRSTNRATEQLAIAARLYRRSNRHAWGFWRCAARRQTVRLHRPGQRVASERFCESFATDAPINRFRLILVVDDPLFVSQGSSSQRLANFLWVIFTRTNPAADTDGIGASVRQKHWGCSGSLVLDARAKPHHAPELAEAAEVTRRVEALAAKGGPLAGLY